MKKICVYLAVLLVLAVFGMTVLAHAGDMPTVPLSGDVNNDLSEVSTDYEVPISIPFSTEALEISQTKLSMIYRQEAALTANAAVTWQSDNNSVVKVDPASGKLTAAGVGCIIGAFFGFGNAFLPMLGAGLLLLGLGLLALLGVKSAIVSTARMSASLGRGIKSLFIRKER